MTQKTFGPYLKLWNSTDEIWTISVLYGHSLSSDPTIQIRLPGTDPNVEADMEFLETRGELSYYRFRIDARLQVKASKVVYSIAGQSYEFKLPASGTMPRLAYGSCNGFHSQKHLEDFLVANDKGKLKATAMWRSLWTAHKGTAYHGIILGGDQVYTDIALDRFKDDVLKWSWYTSQITRRNRRLTTSELDKLRELFTDVYVNSWENNPEMKAVLATCPSMMMWDDHDIMDGWGSYENEREHWPVYKDGIFTEARRAFLLYQQHCKPNENPGGAMVGRGNFSTAHKLGDLSVVHLDTRSERTPFQILSDNSWQKFGDWLESNGAGMKHLFLCVSVPVVYADFEKVEAILRAIPGDQGLEDDLRDHWRSVPHQVCREKMLQNLFHFMHKFDCRVTLISGDVHVAAHGVVELLDGSYDNQARNRIHQLVSSPIMNKAGNFIVEKLVGSQGEAKEVINSSLRARMLPLKIANGNRSKTEYYVWERNWLSLSPQSDEAYRAEWYFEGSDYPCRETIRALDSST